MQLYDPGSCRNTEPLLAISVQSLILRIKINQVIISQVNGSLNNHSRILAIAGTVLIYGRCIEGIFNQMVGVAGVIIGHIDQTGGLRSYLVFLDQVLQVCPLAEVRGTGQNAGPDSCQ